MRSIPGFQYGALSAVRYGVRVAALGLALVAVSGRAGLADNVHEPSPEKIVENFLGVVFGPASAHLAPQPLRKWVKPIRVSVIGTGPSKVSSLVQSHLEHLKYLTKHDIEYLPQGDVNYVVLMTPDIATDVLTTHRALARNFFVSDAVMEQTVNSHRGKSQCYYVTAWNDALIQGALVVVPSGRDIATIYLCLIRQMAQALGLLYNGASPDFSVFSNATRFVDLTTQDMTFLRMLYDPRLKPGMSLDDVRRLAPEILRDIETRRRAQ